MGFRGKGGVTRFVLPEERQGVYPCTRTRKSVTEEMDLTGKEVVV